MSKMAWKNSILSFMATRKMVAELEKNIVPKQELQRFVKISKDVNEYLAARGEI